MSCPQVIEVVTPGPPGPEGPAGPAGVGSAWLQGEGAPDAELGTGGDFYLDTETGDIYGPKAEGDWGSVVFNIAEGREGPAGADGREVQFQLSATHIQWRYTGEALWTDLIALSALQGPAGADGADGAPGADGSDGREIELQTSATHVQWRYVGSPAWTNLISLTALTGPAGDDGSDGADGAPGPAIELQTSATHIQWRVVGASTWTNLIALASLKGDQGNPGADGVAATVTVGTVTTGAAGSPASVSNAGTLSAAVLNFTIPRGDKGDKGDQGDPAPGTDLTYDAATREVRSSTGADAVLPLVTTTTAGLARPVDLGDVIILACSDETTDLTTGTARVTFRMPWAATLTAVRLSVNTAPTGSALIADVNEGGVSVFSTRPQIDAGARTSVGSSVTPVISDSGLAADAEITVDIDQVGSTIKGRGLKIALYVTRVQA